MVPHGMEEVWDICCDHGQVGMAFIGKVNQVVFVDQVPYIMERLTNSLKDSYIPGNCKTIQDSAKNKIYSFNPKTVYIICGIGGDLLIEIMDQIIPLMSHCSFLLISPHKNIHKVRQYLLEVPLGLEAEKLVADKNHIYEVLMLSKSASKTVTLLGDNLWNSEIAASYFSERKKFFSQKATFDPNHKKILAELNQLPQKYHFSSN